MKPLNVSSDRASQIEALCQVPVDDLSKACDEVQSLPIVPNKDLIEKSIALHMSAKNAKTLSIIVYSFALISDQPGRSVDEVVRALRLGLEEVGWDSEKLSKFDKISGYINDLVESNPVYLSAKSSSIFYRTGNHVHRTKVIISSRPIFDRPREKIKAHLVLSTLEITYSDAEENESTLTVDLSYKDLLELLKEAKIAKGKLDEYEKELNSASEAEVVVYGRRLD